jgi:hypothetical protein
MSIYEDQAKAMLRSTKGREALGRLLGCEILQPGDEAKADEIPIVAALVPCYDHPEPRMTDAFMQMQRASQGHCKLFAGPPCSSSVIHWSRNWLIAELIKTKKPWTHVLFLDDDMVPSPDSLIKLLAHKKDIVAGLCTRRQDPPIPNIRQYNEATGEYHEFWAWPENKCIEVGAAGTGMMLITRQALEQVGEVFAECLYEKEAYGLSGERLEIVKKGRRKFYDDNFNGYWFRFLPNLYNHFEMGEDISFCFVAKRYCGISTFCDTSVQPGHVGDYVYSISDFLPHQKVAIRRAKAAQFKQARPENIPNDSARISVLIPSRGNPAGLQKSVEQLRENAARPELLEILIRVDEDDPEPYNFLSTELYRGVKEHFIPGERHGYRNLHLYYNEMAHRCSGDWIMLWNDDAVMEEKGWDDKIRAQGEGLKVLNFTGDLNIFPAMSRSLYQLLGHVSLQAHSDTWLQVIGRECLIEEYIPLQIKHDRKEINPIYKTTSPEFFTDDVQNLLMEDVEKVIATLEAEQKELVPVG